MIKGLAITPPVIGRICIGRLVQKDGKWVPEKDDSFTLTTQVQQKGGWLLHPLHQQHLPKQGGQTQGQESVKIRAIPVRVLFNDSDLNLRAEYSAFDRQTGRPLCVGNGEVAKRVGAQGMEEVSCPGPERCPYGGQQGCKLYGRLNLFVEGQGDELGSFIFRTPVYYVDLTLRDELTLTEAVSQARLEAMRDEESGLSISEMEAVARALLRNGQFEEVDEEVPLLLEEFYPEVGAEGSSAEGDDGAQPTMPLSVPSRVPGVQPRKAPLTNKLGKGVPGPSPVNSS